MSSGKSRGMSATPRLFHWQKWPSAVSGLLSRPGTGVRKEYILAVPPVQKSAEQRQ